MLTAKPKARDRTLPFIIVIKEVKRNTYPFLGVDRFTKCVRSNNHVNQSFCEKGACEMPGLPHPFRVLLLRRDTAMAVQQLPKTLPCRFLFMFHNQLSDTAQFIPKRHIS